MASIALAQMAPGATSTPVLPVKTEARTAPPPPPPPGPPPAISFKLSVPPSQKSKILPEIREVLL